MSIRRWVRQQCGIGARLAMALITSLAILALLTLVLQAKMSGEVLHVRKGATGVGDGSSWADAFTDLQQALNVAQPGDEIWIATGTYTPTAETASGDGRSVSFELVNGVAIYGGFAGTELDRDARSWRAHPVTLTCEIGTPGDPTDNCYSVLTSGAVTSDTIIDGVVVRDGYSLESWPPSDDCHMQGGGLCNVGGSPSLTRIEFRRNFSGGYGGAIYTEGGSPVFDQVSLIDNEGGSNCAGLHNTGDGNVLVSNAVISGNWTHNFGGGGICNLSGTLRIVDTVIVENSAYSQGGGIYNRDRLTMTDSTLVGNRVTAEVGTGQSNGGGLDNDGGQAWLANVVFRANRASSGGGLRNSGGILELINVAFASNSASYGGGLANRDGTMRVTNAIFTNNAGDVGGGIYDTGPNSEYKNVTVASNCANYGGGMEHGDFSPIIDNSIFWANQANVTGDQILHFAGTYSATVRYSVVQGGWSGAGNLDADPGFLSSPNPGPDGMCATDDDVSGDVRLQEDSPAVDAANNGFVPADTMDLDGDGNRAEAIPVDAGNRARFFDMLAVPDTGVGTPPIVDMGATETAEWHYVYLPLALR